MKKRTPFPVHKFAQCESTNSEAQKYIIYNSCHAPRVFISGHQTLGRGQVGANWLDKPDKNALFSVVFPTQNMPIRHLSRWNMWFSTQVATALQKQTNSPVLLKWPNDILLFDKKIGGLLIESSLQGSQVNHIIAGCGINVGYSPAEIPHSNCLQNHCQISVEDVIAGVLEQLYNQPFHPDCREAYHNFLCGYQEWRPYIFNQQKVSGYLEKVDDAGLAHIRLKGETAPRIFRHKEIQWCYD